MAEGGQTAGQGNVSAYSSVHNVHKRGYAAFVVNINPKGDTGAFSTRLSAREDSSNLQYIFADTLGFNWINAGSEHQDLGVGQWNHTKTGEQNNKDPTKCCLCCHIQSLDHSRSDCFVLAISSHGQEVTETEILFSDGQSITLTEIFEALGDEKCPSLTDKPRIILLQACRGNFKDQDRVNAMQDYGVLVKETGNKQSEPGRMGGTCGTDTMDSPVLEEPGASRETTPDYTLQHIALNKMPTDFLLVYPAVSGQLTQRNEIDGSWLIDALKEILAAENIAPGSSLHKINFLHLLTQAAGKVAARETCVFQRENGGKVIKDEDGKEIKDEEKSGLKNAVCIHHRLTTLLELYTQENMDVEIPLPTF